MNNPKHFFFYTCFFYLACSLIFLSCATKKETYISLNYSDTDIRHNEITEIKKKLSSDLLEALWRVYLLKNAAPEDDTTVNTFFEEVHTKIETEFKKAISEKQFQKALDIFISLEACNPLAVSRLAYNKQTLLQEVASTFQTYLAGKNAAQIKASEMIRGTVTVWVDMGFKIDRGRGYIDRSLGSGFFIDKRGYIITNHHVIEAEVNPKYEGYSRVYVKLSEDPENRIPAKVVGWDKTLDLALLKVEVDAPYVFSLGSSSDLEVGDSIFAIGSPVGLESTLTSGIVSSVDRKLFSMGQVMQIDAAINAGNSGGPIVDTTGAVQAIVFAGIAQFNGLNFAIPVEYLKSILSRLYAFGKIDHGWLGLYGKTKRDVTPFGVQNVGVEVLYVMPGSTAFRSGLEKGYTITSIDGTPIATLEELQNLLITKSNKTVLQIKTKDTTGIQHDLLVYFETRPEQPGYEIYKRDTLGKAFLPIFGMELIPTGGTKKFYISTILKSSIADESGFSVQDPIEIGRLNFAPENDALLVEIFTKKRKGGYLEMFLTLGAALDSANYF